MNLLNPYVFGPSATDPYFANVVLLLQSPQTNASTSIVDASPVGRAITVGGAVKSTTAQYKFGSASIQFDGAAADKLTWTSFNLASDFTIEFFYRQTARNTGYEILMSGGLLWQNILLDWNSSKINGAVGCYFNAQSGGNSAGLSLDTWYYYAITRSSTTATVYIDGVSKFSFSLSGTTPWAGVSNYGDSTYGYIGQFDQLRITDGIVRNVSSVPTAPFPDS